MSPRQLFEKLRRDPAASGERCPVLHEDQLTANWAAGTGPRKVCYDNESSDLCDEEDGEGDSKQIPVKEKADSSIAAGGCARAAAVENLYVKLVDMADSAAAGPLPPRERQSGGDVETLPPDTPPPPLPASLPPSAAEKADRAAPLMATMYENVWIDSSNSSKPPASPPAPLPAVPPR